jgi:hypothetical protein
MSGRVLSIKSMSLIDGDLRGDLRFLEWTPELNDLSVGPSALDELPTQIFAFRTLVVLRITSCDSITEFPDELGNLTQLTQLTVYNCESLTCLPATIGNLERLATLKVDDCRSLQGLPPSLVDCRRLKSLTVRYCRAFLRVQRWFAFLPTLDTLIFYRGFVDYRHRMELYPPSEVMKQPQNAINAFLLRGYHEYKMLLLVLAGRRASRPARGPRLPPELWELVYSLISSP